MRSLENQSMPMFASEKVGRSSSEIAKKQLRGSDNNGETWKKINLKSSDKSLIEKFRNMKRIFKNGEKSSTSKTMYNPERGMQKNKMMRERILL